MSYVTVQPGDYKIQGKLDIGKSGISGGLDVGEGGSYQIGLVVYTYDASAVSGSRFTQITDLNASTVLPGTVGDRVYFGHINKFWGVRLSPSVAKTSEPYIMKYWNGSAITTTSLMGILKDSANSVGEKVLEQNIQKEYITWDRKVDVDWAAADNQLDAIPNTGIARCWVCIEVPSGGFSTAPTITEIKIRGSDFDIISGAAFAVYWGRARLEIHERLDFSKTKDNEAKEVDIDITSTNKLTVKAYDAANERISFGWILPDGIDTSCSMEFTINYAAAGAFTPDIELDIRKLQNETAIGIGETSDLTETTSIIVANANTTYVGQSLTNGNYLSIQDLNPQDMLSIEVTKTDSNTTEFYPIALILHYIIWTGGEHV